MSSNKHSKHDNKEAEKNENRQDKPINEVNIEDIPEDNDATADITEDEASGLMQKIDELTTALEKEKNDYLFLRAEFENYRKRTIKEREELIKNAAEKTLRGILPVVDDFERGLKASESVDDAASIREGMELIYNKFMKYLSSNGVTPIESDGQPFNADLHEAIATIPAPADDLKGKVVDTTTRGYMLNDKVLRHAQVAVGE